MSDIAKQARYVEIPVHETDFYEGIKTYLQSQDLMANISDANDLDTNYTNFEAILVDAVNEHTRMKKVKFNKYKHKRNPWVTTGILISIRFRDKLYRRLRQTNPGTVINAELKTNLRTYNRILSKTIRAAKRNHYFQTFDQCRDDPKKTWQNINQVLGRICNPGELPERLCIIIKT